jgi:hypothetical protein
MPEIEPGDYWIEREGVYTERTAVRVYERDGKLFYKLVDPAGGFPFPVEGIPDNWKFVQRKTKEDK